jgi:lipoprotein NlpI
MRCLVVIALGLISCSSAFAASPADRNTCTSETASEDATITACTNIIETRDKRDHAVAYYNRGFAYQNKGESGRAIADYDQAIQLDPNYAYAYNNRGGAYQNKGEYDHAIADYDQAIRLDPKYAYAYYNRAGTYQNKGEYDRAVADYDQAIRLDPKNSSYFRARAVVKYGSGDFKGASADLLRAIELRDDAYSMLFRYLARTRDGEEAKAELEANAGRLKTKEWPYAVTELYLGKRLPAATLDAASKPDERCEAAFYIGQWYVLTGNAANAEAVLKTVADTCPNTFIEYRAAAAELKRLRP